MTSLGFEQEVAEKFEAAIQKTWGRVLVTVRQAVQTNTLYSQCEGEHAETNIRRPF